eukprot:3950733-Pyramimonas_sp.AAC.1
MNPNSEPGSPQWRDRGSRRFSISRSVPRMPSESRPATNSTPEKGRSFDCAPRCCMGGPRGSRRGAWRRLPRRSLGPDRPP